MAATVGPKKTAKDTKAVAKTAAAKKPGRKKTGSPPRSPGQTEQSLVGMTLVINLSGLSVVDKNRINEKIEQFAHDEDILSVLVAFARNPPNDT